MTSTSEQPAPSKVQATAFFIALLAALSAIGQFATNIYLPALPFISNELGAAPAEAQLTLTAYLGAFAVTQIIFGPISDRFGRRIVLYFGLAVFIVGSAVCYAAGNIETLIGGRVLQAIGGGGCTVAARAVVRDSFDGPALQKVMALIAILFALVPGLTPLFGGLLQEFAGWRIIFGVTGAFGALIAVLTIARLPETLAHRLPKLDVAELARGYRIVCSDRAFMRYALMIGLTFVAMFAFFGGSPHTFINYLDVSPTEYGFYPPLASTGFVIGGVLVRRMTGKVSPVGIIYRGVGVLFVAVSIGLFGVLLGHATVPVYIVSVVLMVAGFGVAMPTAMAGALQIFPERAGTASAVVGFLQMAGGGLGSALVAVWQEDHPFLAFPAIMFGSIVAAALVFVLLKPKA